MRKVFIVIAIISAIVLAGCLPQASTTPAITPTTTINPTPSPALHIPTEVIVPVQSDCTVITLKPTPGPTVETVYPPISEADWTKGPADAKVTIVEYGDFQ